MNYINLGISLIVFGFFLMVVLTVFAARTAKKPIFDVHSALPKIQESGLDNDLGYFVIQPGGKVYSIDDNCRAILNVEKQEKINLEKLLNILKPEDKLLELCAQNGEKRLFAGNKEIIASSVKIEFQGIPSQIVSLKRVSGESNDVVEGLQTLALEEISTFFSKASRCSTQDDLIELFLSQLSLSFNADYCGIAIDEADEKWIGYTLDEFELSVERTNLLSRSLGERPQSTNHREILDTKKALLVRNVQHSDLQDLNLIMGQIGEQKSYLGCPILIEDSLFGMIEMAAMEESAFHETDIALINIMIAQFINALRTLGRDDFQDSKLSGPGSEKRSKVYLQSEVAKAEANSAILARINEETSIDRLLHAAADEIMKQFGFRSALILERKGMVLTLDEILGLQPAENPDKVFKVEGPFTEMIENERILIVNSIEESVWREVPIFKNFRKDDFVGFPLRISGSWFAILLFIGSKTGNDFSINDKITFNNLAEQISVNLQNVALFAAADRKTNQLQALTGVAGELTSRLSTQEIIASLLDQLEMVIPFDTATLWVKKENELTIGAAKGFIDDEIRIGLSVALQDSAFFQEMVETGNSIIVGDIREDDRFLSLIEPVFLSWLGIPIIAKDELIGVIALEKKETSFYDSDLVQIGKTFASLAAISLENARNFEESKSKAEELEQRSEKLAVLNQFSGNLSEILDMDAVLKLATDQLLSALNLDLVATFFIMENDHIHLQYENPVFSGNLDSLIWDESNLMQRLKQSGGIYSINDVNNEPGLETLNSEYFSGRKIHSLLVIPLTLADDLIGWFWLQKRDVYRFSSTEIDLAATISNQAAIAIQNAKMFEERTKLMDDLELRVNERTEELQKQHHYSSTLLQIVSELSSSLEFDAILDKTLKVLNEAVGAEQSVMIMADGTSRMIHVGFPLIEPPGEDSDPFTLLPEIEMAGWAVREQTMMHFDNAIEEGRWVYPDEVSINFSSALVIPLIVSEQLFGTLLLLHREKAFFDEGRIALAEAASRQLGFAINNSELYELASDQSERLIDMLKDQEVDSSRSRGILEAVADGVVVTNSDNEITLFNTSAERILETAAFLVVDEPLEEIPVLSGDVGMNWKKEIQNWSNNPFSIKSGQTYAERIELENGKILLVHLAPVIMGPSFLGTVSIFRDITQEVIVDRLKTDFVANISHELRTPMTAIKGYVEILLMGAGGDLSDQQSHFLNVIRDNTERLVVLVNDILDISQYEAGQMSLDLKPADIGQIASEVIEELRNRSETDKKAMNFYLNVEEGLPIVQIDGDRVKKAIWNLGVNGYNYTKENGDVWVRILSGENEVQVDIVDNGIGIVADQHDRIFERFYRGEDPLVLATPGTGLGLAITKILVELQGGRIWFTSEGISGKGSTFSFTIPVHHENKGEK
ncbi:MAG: GAF domain-containing protein [Anaerolineaceae bacterium]|nr:GAF domain-containing protein [Anaerolineaceae bacterium]